MSLISNRRGSVLLMIVFTVFAFMVGTLFIQHLGDGIVSTRVGIECTDVENISDGNKLTCLLVDGVVPYFIMILLSVAFAWVGDTLLT